MGIIVRSSTRVAAAPRTHDVSLPFLFGLGFQSMCLCSLIESWDHGKSAPLLPPPPRRSPRRNVLWPPLFLIHHHINPRHRPQPPSNAVLRRLLLACFSIRPTAYTTTRLYANLPISRIISTPPPHKRARLERAPGVCRASASRVTTAAVDACAVTARGPRATNVRSPGRSALDMARFLSGHRRLMPRAT